MKKHKIYVTSLDLWFMRWFAAYGGASFIWACILHALGLTDSLSLSIGLLLGLITGFILQKMMGNEPWSKQSSSK